MQISAAESAAAPGQSMRPADAAVDSGTYTTDSRDGSDSDEQDHHKDRPKAPVIGQHAAEKLVRAADAAADRRHESQRGTELFRR